MTAIARFIRSVQVQQLSNGRSLACVGGKRLDIRRGRRRRRQKAQGGWERRRVSVRRDAARHWQTEGVGNIMIAPELLEYVAKEAEREVNVMEQVRKAREECALARKSDA